MRGSVQGPRRNRAKGRFVITVNAEKFIADRAAEAGQLVGHAQFHFSEQNFAGQGVTVGVQAVRRQRNQCIARADARTVEYARAVDHADDASNQIVILTAVKSGHLRCFAAEQSASGPAAGAGQPGYDGSENIRVKFPRAEIIEKEKRTRAHDRDVVDAMIDQILANRVMPPGKDSDVQLGADAIHAGDEHGIFHAGKGRAEESAEGADTAENARTVGAAHQRGQSVFQRVAETDVHARFGIG